MSKATDNDFSMSYDAFVYETEKSGPQAGNKKRRTPRLSEHEIFTVTKDPGAAQGSSRSIAYWSLSVREGHP